MASSLLAVLRDARAALGAIAPAEPGEAAVARTLTRELDEAIGRLEGKPPEKDLVSIICHDLKDPLASIVMGSGFLKKTVAADEGSARRVIDAIARSAERMSQVVGDFHDLAKLEGDALAVDVRPCDVGAALQGAIASFAPQALERSVEVTLEAPPEPAMARCDRARLVQIMSKLVGNALRFTPAQGKVVVRVERDGAVVRVSVRDSGRGIAPERLGEIFDRTANARRTPRDGPGLGLAIARGLVELQGGTIAVESRVNEGSCFTFTLPAAS